jgi:hypothetical protein
VRAGGGPILFGLAVLLTSGTLARAASAQAPHLELDLSASRIQYDTLQGLDGPSASLLSEWQRPTLFARLAGSVTGFEDAGWSAQARGSVAGWLSPLGGLSPMRMELGGGGGVSRHSEGFGTVNGRLEGRLHWVGRRAGAWAGASWAAAENSFDIGAVSGVMPAVGLWLQSSSVRGMVGYEHARISGRTYPETSAVVTISEGPVDLTVYGGLRGGEELWGGATGVYWLTDHAAVVLAGGSYASDVLQGLPGGDVLTVGLRLTPRRVRPIPPTVLAPIVYSADESRDGAIGFEVEGADRVEIAGDWNGWRPVPLVRGDSGRWVLATPLEPGTYRFNLLVDGERWMVPESVPTIEDGFGGTVGLLVISPSS